MNVSYDVPVVLLFTVALPISIDLTCVVSFILNDVGMSKSKST